MSRPIVHQRDIQKRQKFLVAWERQRNRKEIHWFIECFAEALGVFLYVYGGIGSTAGYVIGGIIDKPLSSVLQVGVAYAIGILLALAICGGTSGGHFNPCVTICHVIFKGFPPLKAVRYIIAQILGAYISCLVIYAQYKVLIDLSTEILTSKGLQDEMFTPNGPPGIFALYLLPGQTYARVFLAEVVADIVIALTIWTAVDTSNAIITPSFAPVLVSVGYGAVICGYGTPGIALNTARDLGARLMAITIWGTKAFGGKYAAIASLTNIPATIFGAYLYEIFLTDSDRVVPQEWLDFERVIMNHKRLVREKRRSRVQSMVDLEDTIMQNQYSPKEDTEKGMVEHSD